MPLEKLLPSLPRLYEYVVQLGLLLCSSLWLVPHVCHQRMLHYHLRVLPHLLPLPPPQRRLGPLAVPNVRLSMLLMALGLTALASLWLARSITRPVLDLERATLALSAGDLDARTPPRTAQRGDELGRLAGAFDEMAARLAGLMRGREQLLRDVSHEIRSPLARMRLATELARDGVGLDLQLERIDTEVERMKTKP